VLQGSILRPFLFLQYIIDIIKITSTKDDNYKSKLVLFPDDASLIITSPNPTNFIKDISVAFTDFMEAIPICLGTNK
jgi:hypothetical protein